MKKRYLIKIYLALFVIIFSSFTIKLNAQEVIGQKAFKLLKKTNSINKSEFLSHFAEYYEITGIPNHCDDTEFLNDKVVKRFIEGWTEEGKTEYNSHIEYTYKRLKKWGAEEGINWKDIEYLDFVVEISYSSKFSSPTNGSVEGWFKDKYGKSKDDNYGKMVILLGTLYFKYEGEVFSLKEIGAIFNREEYRFVKFE